MKCTFSHDRNTYKLLKDAKREDSLNLSTFHYLPPESLSTVRDVQFRDEEAVRAITEAETLIKVLKEYRTDLAARYAELTVTPTFPAVELVKNRYTNEYWLTKGQKIKTDKGNLAWADKETERFPAADWRKAARAYKDYVRTHPGIEAYTEIKA